MSDFDFNAKIGSVVKTNKKYIYKDNIHIQNIHKHKINTFKQRGQFVYKIYVA